MSRVVRFGIIGLRTSPIDARFTGKTTRNNANVPKTTSFMRLG